MYLDCNNLNELEDIINEQAAKGYRLNILSDVSEKSLARTILVFKKIN